jgi:hypothetical protein
MQGAARLATYLGRMMIVLGLLMIVVAWNGAAGLDFIQGQFPYLLSGSLPGLALIIVGAAMEYIQTTRELTAQRAVQMERLNTSMIKAVAAVKTGGGLVAGPPPTTTAERGPSDEERLATLDYADSAFSSSGTATHADDDDDVVAGRSSFHKQTCHLVSRRDDMPQLSRGEALGRDLSACRVCKP